MRVNNLDFEALASEAAGYHERKSAERAKPTMNSVHLGSEGKLRFVSSAGESPFTKHGTTSFLDRMELGRTVWDRITDSTKTNVLCDLYRDRSRRFATAKKPEDLFFWSYNDPKEGASVRFVGSNSYAQFDNYQAMLSTEPLLRGENIKCRGFHMDPDRLELRATIGDPIYVKGNHHFFLGVSARNSEIGDGAFSGKLMIYDEVCRNGMIIDQIPVFSFRVVHHVNRIKLDSVDYATTIAAVAGAQDRVRHAIDIAQSKILNFNDDALREEYIEDAQKHGVGKRFIEPLLIGERTALKLVSDMTSKSQELSYERRRVIDTYAGNMLMIAA